MNDHQLLANLVEQYSRYVSFKEETGGEITEEGFLNFYGTTIKDKEFPAPELQTTTLKDYEAFTGDMR